MVDDNTARRDVPQLHTLSGTAEYQGKITDDLHKSRAWEYVLSQAAGVSAAIGGVWLARTHAPQAMKELEKLLQTSRTSLSPGLSRRRANSAAMLATGLITSLSSSVLLARYRRDGKEHAEDISMWRDVTRILTGWGIGAIGAVGALEIAEYYGRNGVNKNAVCDIITQAERALDQCLLKGVEYDPGNKLSEAIVANATMIVGALPMTVSAQQLYDSVFKHPAYDKSAKAPETASVSR